MLSLPASQKLCDELLLHKGHQAPITLLFVSHDQMSACVFSCLLLSLFQGCFPGSNRRLLKHPGCPGLCSPSGVSDIVQESACPRPDFLNFWRAEANWSASFIHAFVVMLPPPGITHLLLSVGKFCCLVCFSSHIC